MIMSFILTSKAGPLGLPPPVDIDAFNPDSESFSIFDTYQAVSVIIAGMSPFSSFPVFEFIAHS